MGPVRCCIRCLRGPVCDRQGEPLCRISQGGGAGSSDTPEGELSFQEKAVVEHPGWVCALQWVPERPGSLVSVTASGDISLWNAAQRSQGIKCIGSLTARPHAMRLLDADRVAVSCKDRSVRVLRIEDQSLRGAFRRQDSLFQLCVLLLPCNAWRVRQLASNGYPGNPANAGPLLHVHPLAAALHYTTGIGDVPIL